MLRKRAKVEGRWHDNRRRFITGLAESGKASDETIRDMAGHVFRPIPKHYFHIGMVAKRRAVESLVSKKADAVICTVETLPSGALLQSSFVFHETSPFRAADDSPGTGATILKVSCTDKCELLLASGYL